MSHMSRIVATQASTCLYISMFPNLLFEETSNANLNTDIEECAHTVCACWRCWKSVLLQWTSLLGVWARPAMHRAGCVVSYVAEYYEGV